jgi:hypothetical protein
MDSQELELIILPGVIGCTPTMLVQWHRLVHESGKRVWARNQRIVYNTCMDRACPSKPFLLEGFIQGERLWYAPRDVELTVASLLGTPLYRMEGMGECTVCKRQL